MYFAWSASDDGAFLYIDNKQIIDNDQFSRSTSARWRSNPEKGKHPIRINYFEGGGGYTLSLQWSQAWRQQVLNHSEYGAESH